MGPRAGLDGRKISSPPGFDSGPFSPYSVAIPTELPGPFSLHGHNTVSPYISVFLLILFCGSGSSVGIATDYGLDSP